MNEFLQKIVALDSIIVGGGFILAKGDVLPYPWTIITLSVFVLSLAAAFAGLFPVAITYDEDTAQGVRDYKTAAVWVGKFKGWCMWGAVGLMLTGFVVGMGGLIAKGDPKAEPTIPLISKTAVFSATQS